MKTTNNAQKTENTQVRTVVLRGAAVIFSLVLISWTVSAQDFWKEFFINNSYGKMALLMIDQSSEFEKVDRVINAVDAELALENNAEAISFSIETETDSKLKIEEWMVDESSFNSTSFSLNEEVDESLTLEPWMENPSGFTGNAATLITNDAETSLELESWMVNQANFSSEYTQEAREENLTLEDWMIEDSTFTSSLESAGNPLKLEAWMADSSIWGF